MHDYVRRELASRVPEIYPGLKKEFKDVDIDADDAIAWQWQVNELIRRQDVEYVREDYLPLAHGPSLPPHMAVRHIADYDYSRFYRGNILVTAEAQGSCRRASVDYVDVDGVNIDDVQIGTIVVDGVADTSGSVLADVCSDAVFSESSHSVDIDVDVHSIDGESTAVFGVGGESMGVDRVDVDSVSVDDVWTGASALVDGVVNISGSVLADVCGDFVSSESFFSVDVDVDVRSVDGGSIVASGVGGKSTYGPGLALVPASNCEIVSVFGLALADACGDSVVSEGSPFLDVDVVVRSVDGGLMAASVAGNVSTSVFGGAYYDGVCRSDWHTSRRGYSWLDEFFPQLRVSLCYCCMVALRQYDVYSNRGSWWSLNSGVTIGCSGVLRSSDRYLSACRSRELAIHADAYPNGYCWLQCFPYTERADLYVRGPVIPFFEFLRLVCSRTTVCCGLKIRRSLDSTSYHVSRGYGCDLAGLILTILVGLENVVRVRVGVSVLTWHEVFMAYVENDGQFVGLLNSYLLRRVRL